MQPHDEIERTLRAFYMIISGHKTEKRDWDALRSIFYAGATLFPNSVTQNASTSRGINVDAYIESLDGFLSRYDFFEEGTISQIVLEHNIASAVSTYEAKRSIDDNCPFKRGVNFVHFVHTGKTWKITSMIWRDS